MKDKELLEQWELTYDAATGNKQPQSMPSCDTPEEIYKRMVCGLPRPPSLRVTTDEPIHYLRPLCSV